MNRRNLISYVITILATAIGFFVVLTVCNNLYGGQMFDAILRFLVGAIIAGFLNTVAHELGHYFAGKKNGFVFSSMSIWFFKWKKVEGKTKFQFVLMGEEAGYTEMIPTQTENIDKKFAKMTKGGIVASFIVTLLGIPPLFMGFLPIWIYSIWAMFLPVGLYYFFGTYLPTVSGGMLNDGAVLQSIKKQTDSSKVMINLLKIQVKLYSGKLPSEIDESVYFDLPQLPEDDMNFAMLLNARYSYYVDKEDFENAKKVSARLLSLEEYLPKNFVMIAKTDALYNACTFDYNEEVADDLLYEVEDYINNVNSATNLRVKIAYLVNVNKEMENLDMFFKKAYKEASKEQLKGLTLYETKLLDKLKNR